MNTFLLLIAVSVLLLALLGLIRALRAQAPTDRLVAVQLLGSGALAALLVAGVIVPLPAALDAALVLALLAPFAPMAVLAGSGRPTRRPDAGSVRP